MDEIKRISDIYFESWMISTSYVFHYITKYDKIKCYY